VLLPQCGGCMPKGANTSSPALTLYTVAFRHVLSAGHKTSTLRPAQL
jgi:hypothetical protein